MGRQHKIKYDYYVYQILKDYCAENPKITVETLLGYKCTVTNAYILSYVPHKDVLFGDIEGPDCGPKDRVTIYPEGDAHISRQAMLGSEYIEVGTAYIEWEK